MKLGKSIENQRFVDFLKFSDMFCKNLQRQVKCAPDTVTQFNAREAVENHCLRMFAMNMGQPHNQPQMHKNQSAAKIWDQESMPTAGCAVNAQRKMELQDIG